jgi:hypothetical protein
LAPGNNFTLGSPLTNKEFGPIVGLGASFSTVKVTHQIFPQKWVGPHFERIFTNLSGHAVSNIPNIWLALPTHDGLGKSP